jgi:MFS transporter, DHA1 family, multidrug resistance protein
VARMLAGSKAPGAATVMALGLLTALGPLSIDLYLPAFPALRRELAATDGSVQLTLAGMTVGLGLGQLAVGIWSDRVGRRIPLLLSTGLHVLATVACALAPSVAALAAFRVAQGIGAAGSSVLVLAMVRDLADGPALVTLLSRVTLVTTAAPLVAPVAGAELLRLVGWRGIFWMLAIGSAAVLVTTAVLVPETRRDPSPPAYLLSRLRAVCSDRTFRIATVVASMTYAGIYAYVAASPTLLQEVYGLTVRGYALVFLLNSLGLVAGVQLSGLLARKTRPSRVLAGFTLTTVLAAEAIVPLQQAHAGVAGLLACLWVFVASCGGCFPCAEALALTHQGDQSGTASSVHGFTAFTVAGLVSPLAGLAGIGNATPVAIVLLTTSATALLSVGLLLRSIAQQGTTSGKGAHATPERR